MPIYEYVCQNCGRKYEKLVRSSSSEPELKCPHCGSNQAKKALSLFGTHGAGGETSWGAASSSAASCGPVG
jgi:putative FmdB family regulatory protein